MLYPRNTHNNTQNRFFRAHGTFSFSSEISSRSCWPPWDILQAFSGMAPSFDRGCLARMVRWIRRLRATVSLIADRGGHKLQATLLFFVEAAVGDLVYASLCRTTPPRRCECIEHALTDARTDRTKTCIMADRRTYLKFAALLQSAVRRATECGGAAKIVGGMDGKASGFQPHTIGV